MPEWVSDPSSSSVHIVEGSVPSTVELIKIQGEGPQESPFMFGVKGTGPKYREQKRARRENCSKNKTSQRDEARTRQTISGSQSENWPH